MDFNAIWERVQRAIKLVPGVYEEIGNDQRATGQAMVVMGAASLISGLAPIFGPGDFGFGGWIGGAALAATLGLAIITGVIYIIGKFFQGQGEYIQLFRSLGFAGAPGALGIIPWIGGLAGVVWTVILAIRAVKEINRVSDGAAIATVLIPAAIFGILAVLLIILAGIALLGFAASQS